ncbi:MAG: LbtU family siderophore porin [Pseudomonadota bacterium]|nr:hypothetical protein [Gammaproteobacteria bacterium]MEC8010807.1 LbtU family siderophore porin [Pseudomonadota bacterium]
MNSKHNLKLSIMTLALAGISTQVSAQTTEELERRIAALEEQAETQSSSSNSGLVIAGAVEVEAAYGEDYAGEASSDVAVATVELGLSHEISNELSANVVLLFEEDDTPLEVDVATLTYSPWESFFSFNLGQDYMPFGTYETMMVNDPLTLEIGETRETAIVANFENGPLNAAAYIFNGDQDQNNRDVATQYGARVGFANDVVALSADYISNIAESDGLQENDYGLAAGADFVAGASASAVISLSGAQIVAEHVRALDTLEGDGSDSEPSATHFEIGFENDVFNYAFAYQVTDEAFFLELPKERISLGLSKDFYHGLSMGIELSQDRDYDIEDGGTDETANNIVFQFAAAI